MDKRKLAFYFLFNHLPTFINYWGPKAYGRFCRVRLYQEPACLSKGGVFRGGRRWGKTFLITWKFIQAVFRLAGKQQLLTTLRRAHRENVFDELQRILLSVPLFRAYLLTGQKRESIRRDITYSIEFKNKSVWYGIAVGDDPKATQIKGKGPALKIIDEAQDYPSSAAEILTSTEDPEGCEEYWAGVVDGRRDTAFYRAMEKSSTFRTSVFKFSRRYDPHFNQSNLRKLREIIEGGEEGDRFKQEVDAEHGNPITGVWNIDDIIRSIAYNPVDPFDKQMAEIVITPSSFTSDDELFLILSRLPVSVEPVIFGIDLGLAEPTTIMPFVLENDVWTCKSIIFVRDYVDITAQKKIIRSILERFPSFMGAGIDVTNSPAIADMLVAERGDWQNKIVRVRFNSNIVYGSEYIGDEEQAKRYFLEYGKKVRIGEVVQKAQKTKIFSTSYGSTLLAQKKISFYYHKTLVDDFSAEIAVHSVSSNTGGVKIITPVNVHIPEAFRCFAVAHWTLAAEGVRIGEEPVEIDDIIDIRPVKSALWRLYGGGRNNELTMRRW